MKIGHAITYLQIHQFRKMTSVEAFHTK